MEDISSSINIKINNLNNQVDKIELIKKEVSKLSMDIKCIDTSLKNNLQFFENFKCEIITDIDIKFTNNATLMDEINDKIKNNIIDNITNITNLNEKVDHMSNKYLQLNENYTKMINDHVENFNNLKNYEIKEIYSKLAFIEDSI